METSEVLVRRRGNAGKISLIVEEKFGDKAVKFRTMLIDAANSSSATGARVAPYFYLYRVQWENGDFVLDGFTKSPGEDDQHAQATYIEENEYHLWLTEFESYIESVRSGEAKIISEACYNLDTGKLAF